MQHKNFLKFSSITMVIIGLILLFGPKHWHPDFYNPIFMGVIALISPFIIYLPEFVLKKETPQKRNVVLQMRSIIAFSLTINIAGELGLYQLYKFGFEYDKLAHFIVSMLFAFILGETFKEWGRLPSRKIVWLVFLIVFGSGILWEIFEVIADVLFKTKEWGVYGQYLVSDTFKDIGFNSLGALAGIIVFKIPQRRRKESNVKSVPKRGIVSS